MVAEGSFDIYGPWLPRSLKADGRALVAAMPPPDRAPARRVRLPEQREQPLGVTLGSRPFLPGRRARLLPMRSLGSQRFRQDRETVAPERAQPRAGAMLTDTLATPGVND